MAPSHLLTTPSAAPSLVRAIGRWDLTAAVINAVIGAGVFGLPGTLAALTGAWSTAALLGAGLAAMLIVVCFAEVASRFDEAGGPYLYTRTAFGSFIGFQVGWLHVWTRLFSGAAVLHVFVAYLVPFVPGADTPAWRAAIMTALVLMTTAVNVLGVRQASWTVNLFTIGKLFPLLLLVAVGAVHVRFDGGVVLPPAEMHWADALVLAMFAYGGFESGLIAASETRRPRTDTAFALCAAIACVAFVYVGVQLVVTSVLSSAGTSTAPVVDTLGVLLGRTGMLIGGIGALVSAYGWLTGFCLMTPRILYAMARAHELPALFGRVHPRYRTPHVAIVLNAAAALALALSGTFAGTATFSVLTRIGIYVLTCAALPVLRRTQREPSGFVLPAGSAIAMAAIAYCLWMLGTRSLDELTTLAAIVTLGAALWAAARWRRQSSRA